MTAPAETAPVEPTEPVTPPPSPANMPQTQPPVAAAPTTEPEGDSKDDKPDTGESTELAKIRREAANYRTKLRETEAAVAAQQAEREQAKAEAASLKETLAKLAAVLNPDANQPPDPAQLTEQLTAAQAETARVQAEYQQQIRDLTIRAALPNVLTQAKADPGLTEAVLTASGALAKLDPSADTFTADLESAVAEAMEKNPRLKVDAPVAPSKRSGAEIPGRSGGSNQITREQLAGMKPADIDKARKAGQLTSLGIGPG